MRNLTLRLAVPFCALLSVAGCERKSAPTTTSTEVPAASAVAPVAPGAATSAPVSTEDAALAAVTRVLVAQGRDPSCVSFLPSRADGRTEVEVREKHGGKCGGDPAVAPVLGRYRVSATADVTSYDVASDSWAPVGTAATGGATTIVGTKVLERDVKDSTGSHHIVLTTDRHGKGQHLYAYDFCDAPPSPGAACWTIKDGVDACDDDLVVEFVGDKLYSKDNGGQLAVAVLYRIRCSSDLSAYDLKLVGYESGKKFAVRGTTGLRRAGGAMDFEPKRTPDVADATLRPWALGLWDKFAIDKM